MLNQKNFEILRLRNGIFNILHEIFLCLKMTGSSSAYSNRAVFT